MTFLQDKIKTQIWVNPNNREEGSWPGPSEVNQIWGWCGLVEGTLIRHRWQTYFYKLLNVVEYKNFVMDDLEHSEIHRDFGYHRCVKVEKVELCIKWTGTLTKPDKILIGFWKNAGKTGLEWLTGFFCDILKTTKMPKEWIRSMIIRLYRNKGDI